MLVLSRKEGEKILIGDQIEITVVRVSPTSVRIGLVAPPHLTIIREELKHRVKDAGVPMAGPDVADEEPRVATS